MSSLPSATSFPSSSFPFSISTSNYSVITLNQTCSFDDPDLRLPLAALYSLFFLFGLVCNSLALWVFFYISSRRNSVRVFLINCAVADLVLLACLPFRVFYHVNGNNWVMGTVVCKLVGNLFYMSMYISITLLGLISLDRYSRLKGKGKKWKGMKMMLWGRSLPWSWVACGALWGLSLLALMPMIATAEDREEKDKCFHYRQRNTKANGKAYFNAVLVVFFWFVFIMLVVSYAKIALQLLRASRDKPDLPNAQRYERIAKKSFFVLFLFIVCFAPYHAFRPIYIYYQLSETASCDDLQLVDRTNEMMLLLSAFNSCLDPVMYFLLCGTVRKTALQALACQPANHLLFLNHAPSNSSTTEFRRPSAPMTLPNTPSVTPRTSICVIGSTLHHTGLTTLPPTGQ